MIPIFVINRDCDTERLARMTQRLTALGLPFERLPAVEGATLSDAFIAGENRRAWRRPISRAEAGCLHSHLTLWKRIAQGSDEAAMILEDDMILADSLPDLLADLSWLPSDDCVIRLELFPMPVVLGRPVLSRGTRTLYPQRSVCFGAGAYILTRKRARAVLDFYRWYVDAADNLLFMYPRRQHAYQWQPAPCIQERVCLPGSDVTPSTLETQRRQVFTTGGFGLAVAVYKTWWLFKKRLGIRLDLLAGHTMRIMTFG